MDAKATYQQLKETFAPDLEEATTSLQAAAVDYNVAKGTLSHWIKVGLIRVIEPAKRRGMASKISSRDVAVMVELNRQLRAEGKTRGPLKGWKKLT